MVGHEVRWRPVLRHWTEVSDDWFPTFQTELDEHTYSGYLIVSVIYDLYNVNKIEKFTLNKNNT